MSEFLKTESQKTLKPLEKQVMQEVYFVFVDKQIAELSRRDEYEKLDPANPAIWRQFYNVLLRYEDQDKWKDFLYWLCRRKKWWNEKDKKLADGVPVSIRQFWEWINDEANNSANKCLQNAKVELEKFYYPEGQLPKTRLSKRDWEAIAEGLSASKWVVLREILLRLTGRAL